jgi:hypothetical protein
MAYQICPMYNLKSAVGRNSPNLRGDVALVEGLLEVVYGDRSLEFWRSFYANSKVPFPAKPLSMKASYDERLQSWIDFFLHTQSAVTQDGRFDPLRFKNGTVYTASGDKLANFYMLMFRAFTIDSRKCMALGSTFNLLVAIHGPDFGVTRSTCGM